MKTGYADSIVVHQDPRTQRWVWTVWHPNGGDFGGAATEAEAWKKARRALEFHESHPVYRQGQGQVTA